MASTTHHRTMRSDTRAVTIGVPVPAVFEFVSDPENLPRWAVGFCQAVRRDDASPDRWLVTTAQGEMPIRFETNAQLGVIDFHLFPAPGVEAVAHSRVVPNGDGAEYVFTQLQAPGMPDSVFEGQVHALVEELTVLQALMAARAACPHG